MEDNVATRWGGGFYVGHALTSSWASPLPVMSSFQVNCLFANNIAATKEAGWPTSHYPAGVTAERLLNGMPISFRDLKTSHIAGSSPDIGIYAHWCFLCDIAHGSVTFSSANEWDFLRVD